MIRRLSMLKALIKKEFLAIWKDPKSRAIIIMPPLVQLLIFANALTMEVKNVDMMVLDYSNTQESRELIAGFEYSKAVQRTAWFGKIIRVNSIEDIEKNIETRNIEAAVIVNSDFAVNLKRGQPAAIQLILDGRNPSTAASMNSYITQVASAFSQKLSANGLFGSGTAGGAAIGIEIRNWFNPDVIYQWYLLTSLIVMLAMMVTLILTALSVARERELGTFEQLIVSPYTSVEILLGKTIPPLMLSLIMLSLMTFLLVTFFDVPFNGSFLLFVFSVFIALLSFVGVGLFISSISRNQQQAILGVFTFMMPSILLSGFLSPVEDMPAALQYFTYLDPVRFFMNIGRGMFLKGMQFDDVFVNLVPLGLIALVTLTLAATTFKRNLE